MDERRIRIGNVALVDLHKAADESLARIDSIHDAALVVMRKGSAAESIAMNDVVMVAKVDGDTEFRMVNGESRITCRDAGKQAVYMMANGVLNVDGDVEPDMIRSMLCGLIVNGKLRCTRRINDALSDMGAMVNGTMEILPDGAIILDGTDIDITAEYAANAKPGIYAVRSVRAFDAQALALLAEKQVSFFTGRALCSAGSEDALRGLMCECSPKIIVVPEGFTYLENMDRVDRIKVRRLKGRVFINGGMALETGIKPEQLGGIEALKLTGRLTVTEAQLDAMDAADIDCASLRVREACDICVNDDFAMNAAAIDALEAGHRLIVDGDMKFDDDVTPEQLREKFSEIEIDGDVTAPGELWGVLHSLGEVSGDMKETEAAAPAEDEADDSYIYISDVAQYTL